MNSRIFLEKKESFRTEAKNLFHDIQHTLNIPNLRNIRVLIGFDLMGIPEHSIHHLAEQVLGDPVSDYTYRSQPDQLNDSLCFSIEFLPGQFDQRADAAEQAIKLLDPSLDSFKVSSFYSYILEGDISTNEREQIIDYLLNPVESRLKDLTRLETSKTNLQQSVQTIEQFNTLSTKELDLLKEQLGLSLLSDDLRFIQDHFKTLQRNPTETEIRVLDTYWSDHCRHTTFFTELSQIEFEEGKLQETLQKTFDDYLAYRQISKIENRPVTLMDLATINSRTLRKQGRLNNVEISDEINACSVFIDVSTKDKKEKWLLQFKNETHNHPTEIEPFGGASTCLGGAIRDPLSGRSYIYQAIRITGASNPLEPIDQTLTGKLPQSKISKCAALGFSSYGNQIGIATTQLREFCHPGYKAKRMEVGAVVAAVPAKNVIRQKPKPGDQILLLGGKTGRDGCGGASGSSKSHHKESLATSGAEVQKGNPLVERAIQRLFRNGEVAQKIKKCNDFGAGGVCVAVGELADSLHIYLEKVPVKYQGLTPTELTISESQERMAVVVDKSDVDFMIQAATLENVGATVIAEVTDTQQMVITYHDQVVVNLNRDFIETAGVKQNQKGLIAADIRTDIENPFLKENKNLLEQLKNLNQASQRGIQDMFDNNVGASTVLLPYGGKNQASPAEASVQLLPKSETSTASAISYGFDPYISEYSPYHGGAYAVIESITRQLAVGASIENIYFSFQEYFEKLGRDPKKWGKPFSSLLGAFSALKAFDLAAIGGKDSMSGTFDQIHVPPTLISFAVSHLDAKDTVSSELKSENEFIYLLPHNYLTEQTPNYNQLKSNFSWLAANKHQFSSLISVKQNGYLVELAKACLGNEIGVYLDQSHSQAFKAGFGSLLIVSQKPLESSEQVNLIPLGKTVTSGFSYFDAGKQTNLSFEQIKHAYQTPLEPLFPLYPETNIKPIKTINSVSQPIQKHSTINIASPRVFIPVFPGTNSEYDMQQAFVRNGGKTIMQPFVNLTPKLTKDSINSFCEALKKSQIFALSGGFSAGDEPNGSGKYIAILLKQAQIQDAIHQFLENDGLVLGICNGFQALIKSGLLPYGKITPRTANDFTLEHNLSHRHIARIAKTRICQNHSPWLSGFSVGEQHDVAFSHGEGRFIATSEQIEQLIQNGQVATQYVSPDNQASMDPRYNPNGSESAIEAITSPCGRILGKMGHSERVAKYTYLNYPDFKEQNIFTSGIHYFQ